MTRSSLRPPAVPTLLVRRCAPRGESDFVVADLAEEFEHRVARIGLTAARRWYWSEALTSCTPLLVQRWRSARRTRRSGDSMRAALLDDVRFALRLARRSPLAS